MLPLPFIRMKLFVSILLVALAASIQAEDQHVRKYSYRFKFSVLE